MKKKLLLGIGLAALLTLTACGNTSKDASKETQTKEHYPLTIENFTKAEGDQHGKRKIKYLIKHLKELWQIHAQQQNYYYI